MTSVSTLWALACATVAFTGIAGTSAVFPTSEPFTLTIGIASPQLTAGDAVKITVKLSNNSTVDVRSPPSLSRPDLGETLYDVKVTFPNGTAVPGTAYDGWLKRAHLIWTYGIAGIPPGGVFEDGITVSKLFDMTAPGEYVIQVCAD